MMSTLCGPNGNATLGRVVEVNAKLGKELVDGRFARDYDEKLDRKCKHGWEKPER